MRSAASCAGHDVERRPLGAEAHGSIEPILRFHHQIRADQGGQSGNQPATSGQGGNKMQPPANQDVGNAQPSNQGQSPATGQGGNATQSPSPNMNQNNMNHSAPRSGGQAK